MSLFKQFEVAEINFFKKSKEETLAKEILKLKDKYIHLMDIQSKFDNKMKKFKGPNGRTKHFPKDWKNTTFSRLALMKQYKACYWRLLDGLHRGKKIISEIKNRKLKKKIAKFIGLDKYGVPPKRVSKYKKKKDR